MGKKKKDNRIEQMKEQHENATVMSRYDYVMNSLICKLNLIDAELKTELKRPVIQKITSRIKSIESICKKLEKKEKDYVSRPKKSGYQSIHLIVEVPVSYYEKVENIRAEIQIRSFAMDYWAELDYQMCYKKSAGEVETIRKEISSYSDVMAEMDRKMIELRKRIEKETIKAGGRKS